MCGQWFRFDDDLVEAVTADRAIQCQYGGSECAYCVVYLGKRKESAASEPAGSAVEPKVCDKNTLTPMCDNDDEQSVEAPDGVWAGADTLSGDARSAADSSATGGSAAPALVATATTPAVSERSALEMSEMVASIRRIDSELEVRLITCPEDIAACFDNTDGQTLGRTAFIVNGKGLHYSALLADASRISYFEPAADGGMRARNQPLLIQLRNMLHVMPLFGDEPIPIEPGIVPCTSPPRHSKRVRMHARARMLC